MRNCSILAGALVTLAAAPLWAASLSDEVLAAMRASDVVLLGEVHDNPDHHAVQAEALTALRPKAVVWEMISAETAARINAGWLDDPDNLAKAMEWAEAGWPGFAFYVPVLDAAKGLPVYGGLVPRQAATAVMDQGIAIVFGASAAEYGLMVPLADADQAAREADQFAAHCEAIPAEQLPMMVDFQRLRDAMLARAVVVAIGETGGPVAVITGNGHARTDRGVPEVLRRVRPGLRLFALGQSEDGRIEGVFDAVHDSPEADRPDPCEAFRKAD